MKLNLAKQAKKIAATLLQCGDFSNKTNTTILLPSLQSFF